jgi:L-Lysine epsilon oxidase N-terminal/L-lysine epsilon oxidase C-terminal domain
LEPEKIKLVRTARIHPAIGIARLGNSLDHYFIGPEIPRVYEYPKGGFRDDLNCLKRQAARFRIFGYDEHNRLLGEICASDADIGWSVHLRNTKAVGRIFAGVLNPDEQQRNSNWIKKNNRESQLVLDPKIQTVSDRKTRKALFCRAFMGVKFDPVLELGKLIYEEGTGRLLVLGGHGRSGSPRRNKLVDKGDFGFANHDGWFDDISDGPVAAEVTLAGGRKLFVKSAWVIVAPPKFAPELQTIVTLYDTLYQVAIDRGLIPDPFSDPKFVPSFNRDIYPILRRADEMRWVFAKSNLGHSFAISPGESAERAHIFRQFRAPSGHPREPGTGSGRMPFIWSDLYLTPPVNGTLTRTQYKIMQAWAENNFEDDWVGRPPSLSFQISPDGLDRAALEACVGAAFYPGIEVSWKIRDVFKYVEPFRLDANSLSAGDVTQQMSLPWQTDFVDCAYEDPYVWWPAQRPIDVLHDKSSPYRPWARRFDGKGNDPLGAKDMVHDFYRLGLVLRSDNGFYETGRVEKDPRKKFNLSNFAKPSKDSKRRKEQKVRLP